MPSSAPPSSTEPSFPSYEILLRYLSALDFHGRGEDSLFAWQTFDDKASENQELLSLRHGTLVEQWRRLCDLNLRGAGVHVGIHVTDGQGRRKENILHPRAVVLDFDDGDPPTGVRMVPASMVVLSARGPHYYWLLEQEQDLAQWRRVQLGMARRYHADTDACVYTQTIRAPGFFHHKKDPFPIRIDHLEVRRYTLDELAKGFVLDTELRQIRQEEAEVARRQEEARSRVPSNKIDLYTNRLDRARAYLDRVPGASSGARNNTTAKTVVPIGWRFGIERDSWLFEVQTWNERCNNPPLDPRAVQSCVFSMWDYMARTGEPFGSLLDVDSDAWKERQAQWEEKLRQREQEEEDRWSARLEHPDGEYEQRSTAADAQPSVDLSGVSFVDLLDLPRGALPAMPDGRTLSLRGDVERFMLAHGHEVRRCEPLDKWYMWTGQRWDDDKLRSIYNLVQQTITSVHELREHPDIAFSPRDDKQERKRKADLRSDISAHVLRAEKPSAIKDLLTWMGWQSSSWVLPDALDKDDRLVNTPSGVVDVTDLSVRPHDPKLYQTRITGAPYVATAKSDLWRSFIRWAMCEDEELISFLQRAAGVSITGDAEDHVFFVCFGTGGNGKSTFVKTMLRLAGGYGRVCDFNMFLEDPRQNSRAPNEELLALKDVRMVFASEPEEGKRLREDVIKRITGGEPISARPLFGSPIEFQPKFSLWLSANHRPAIRGTDDGIWRRVLMIPWEAKITRATKDTSLGHKLVGELPGILRWVLEGANEWHRNGLQIPEKVQKVTTAYREDMDEIGSFLQLQTVAYEGAKVASSKLYECYRRWCDEQGTKAFKQKTFNQRIEERGYPRHKMKYGICFLGLGLLYNEGDVSGSSSSSRGGDADDDCSADDERRAIQEEGAADSERARQRGRTRGQHDLF